jgi:hypothetical protein
MRRLFPVFCVVAVSLVGCASPPKAYIPVDSPLRPWSPPEDVAETPDEPAPPAASSPADAKAVAPAAKKAPGK